MEKQVQNKQCRLKRMPLIAALFMVAFFFLSGCNLLNIEVASVKFNTTEIILKVGESKKISSAIVIVSPTFATNKNYTLSSSNEEIFSVSNTGSIHALSVGTATLIATTEDKNLTAECLVTVTYATIGQMELEYSGLLVQDYLSAQQVQFWATFNSSPDPSLIIKWYVNNKKMDERAVGVKFAYKPPAIGRYSVKAETVNDLGEVLSSSLDINVYMPFVQEPLLVYDDRNLIQDEGLYKNVTMSVEYENSPSNPSAIIEWFVNSALVKTSDDNDKAFSFRPTSAGTYVIQVRVNGNLVLDSVGQDRITILAKGSIVPQNIRLDMDNCYPKINLSWDNAVENMRHAIKIVIMGEENRVITDGFSDFSGNSVDISDFIGENEARNVFNTRFSIYVKSLSDGGDILTDSEYSKPYHTTTLQSAGKEFLAKKYFGGNRNYYCTSIEELSDIFAYTRMYRKTLIQNNESVSEKFSAFLDFVYDTSDLGTKDMLKKAFTLGNATGEYGYSYSVSSRVINIEITYKTDGIPSRSTEGEAQKPALHAMRPHVNYDETKVRDESYVFPIDKISTPRVSVSTSEQLFYVIEQGYNPLPEPNSSADFIYQYARMVLRTIITDDMDDVDKAHAIYDYVMWRTSYDHAVLPMATSVANAVKYSSYYLEGVFGIYSNSIFNTTRAFAVCDGISKAYSILANIEGIPCVRIAGDAGGGHAWNKVKIDNKWYIVDCTWGDEVMNLNGESREMAFHRYFLKTDAEMPSHIEDTPNNYPKTETTPFNWYDRDIAVDADKYSFSSIDFYFDDLAKAYEEAENLVNYLLDNKPEYENYYLGNQISNDFGASSEYVAYDIKIHNNLKTRFTNSSSENPIVAAMADAKYTLGTHYYILNDSRSDALYMFIFIRIMK